MSADTRPRCEVTVQRYTDSLEEADIVTEPCGRLAKSVVRVGSRDIPACWVHVKQLLRLEALR